MGGANWREAGAKARRVLVEKVGRLHVLHAASNTLGVLDWPCVDQRTLGHTLAALHFVICKLTEGVCPLCIDTQHKLNMWEEASKCWRDSHISARLYEHTPRYWLHLLFFLLSVRINLTNEFSTNTHILKLAFSFPTHLPYHLGIWWCE